MRAVVFLIWAKAGERNLFVSARTLNLSLQAKLKVSKVLRIFLSKELRYLKLGFFLWQLHFSKADTKGF
jgi:hypothetical protein